MKLSTIIAAAALCLLVPGCGSSTGSSGQSNGGTITKAQWIARSDAICAEGSSKLNAVPLPVNPSDATAGDLDELSRYFEQVGPIFSDTESKLKALPDPDDGKDQARAYVAAEAGVASAFANAAAAAKAGNLDEFKSEFSSVLDKGLAASKVAVAYGNKSCGSGAGDATSTEDPYGRESASPSG